MIHYTCPNCKHKHVTDEPWNRCNKIWACCQCTHHSFPSKWFITEDVSISRRVTLIKRGQTLKRKSIIRRDAPKRGEPLMFGPSNFLLVQNNDRTKTFWFKGT